ncbi:MAG: Hpt domain-containing protein [Balneolales bacterium]|nr:Hpt domain-containing protein [Balneolales bacterium]
MTNSENLEDLPVWDRQGMLDRIGGDNDIAMAVVEGFLMTIPEQVHVLKDFLDEGNLSGILHTAHSLKGVAATVGGERLRKIALNMETTGKEENLAEAQANFEAFQREFDALFDAIKASDLNPENG